MVTQSSWSVSMIYLMTLLVVSKSIVETTTGRTVENVDNLCFIQSRIINVSVKVINRLIIDYAVCVSTQNVP